MTIEMLQSKIHRAKVTDANLNYKGSITIDEKLIKAAGMREWQKVDVLDINNGERFSTYIIKGGEGEICLNGAAARKVAVGDLIIIVTYAHMSEAEAENFEPKIVHLNEKNQIVE